MDNRQLIEKFYQAFAAADAEGMVSCYHENVEFQDPAFGVLRGRQAGNMWRMLVSPTVKVSFGNVQADERTGRADWQAEYLFTLTGRKVVNTITARFEFQDGKIIRHTDKFDFWKWARQAFGLKGWLLGWTPLMQNKVRQQANARLSKFSRGKEAAGEA
jgi:ketosteroid isomerase-like protein